jgi:hypothetical protein
MFGLMLAVAGAQGTAAATADATVTTIAGICGRAGYSDGPAGTALFNHPSRVQAVLVEPGVERLFVLDDSNGCVRSLPLLPAAGNLTAVVRAETPCAGASTLAHTGPDVKWPNGSSRGWAHVDGPQDFWVSAGARSIYVLDTDNNRVKFTRRRSSSSPSSTPTYSPWVVLAGSGAVGHADGNATSASFTQPHGLSVAPRAGFAFVADTFASCVRAVRIADGAVTTIAGRCGEGGHQDSPAGADGARSTARFNHPHKVTVDTLNESVVYVSDVECFDDGPWYLASLRERGHCGNRSADDRFFTGVRRLELAYTYNGGGGGAAVSVSVVSVSTVAGFFNSSQEAGAATASNVGFEDGDLGRARFHYVHGVAMQPAPRSHSAAAAQHRAPRGGGSRSFSSVLFAIDDLNYRVRRIDLAAGSAVTLAGSGRRGCRDGAATSATFNGVGLAVGGDGLSVYVADYGNHVIRQIKMTGSLVPTV